MLCFVVSSVDLRNLRNWFAADEIFIFNRPSSQIPQCLRHIHVCHSVTFCNRDVAICIDFFYIEVHLCDIGRVHCGINVRIGRIQHFQSSVDQATSHLRQCWHHSGPRCFASAEFSAYWTSTCSPIRIQFSFSVAGKCSRFGLLVKMLREQA